MKTKAPVAVAMKDGYVATQIGLDVAK